jgi:hypothetical protein
MNNSGMCSDDGEFDDCITLTQSSFLKIQLQEKLKAKVNEKHLIAKSNLLRLASVLEMINQRNVHSINRIKDERGQRKTFDGDVSLRIKTHPTGMTLGEFNPEKLVVTEDVDQEEELLEKFISADDTVVQINDKKA